MPCSVTAMTTKEQARAERAHQLTHQAAVFHQSKADAHLIHMGQGGGDAVCQRAAAALLVVFYHVLILHVTLQSLDQGGDDQEPPMMAAIQVICRRMRSMPESRLRACRAGLRLSTFFANSLSLFLLAQAVGQLVLLLALQGGGCRRAS